MKSILELSIEARAFLMLLLFMETVLGFVFLFGHRRRCASILLSIVCLICLALLGLMHAIRFDLQHGVAMPHLMVCFAQLPVLLLVGFTVAIAVYLTFAMLDILKTRRESITEASIKDALDYLPTGLSFSRANGRILLTNYRMNQLSFELCGCELQDAQKFWSRLCQGNIISPSEALGEMSFRLADGSIWSFTQNEIEDGIVQILASDTTELHKLTDMLQKQNVEMTELNMRLRQYSQDVDAVTRAQERLDTKVRIHNELGRTLLSTRRYLNGSEGNVEEIQQMWRQCIAMLLIGEQAAQESLDQLRDVAQIVGIDMKVSGELPLNPVTYRLFLDAITDALTNAARHGNANALWIRCSCENGQNRIQFINDGDLPKQSIVEGGGLSTLRKRVEKLGGTMQITMKPQFEVELYVPVESEG